MNRYDRYPGDYTESDAVRAVQQKIADFVSDGSHWARAYRKHLAARLRAQRLADARERGTHTNDEWLAILDRYDYRCVGCGCRPDGRPTKDHIIPLFMGGSDAAENLQPVCRECNTSKLARCIDWRAYRDDHGWEAPPL